MLTSVSKVLRQTEKTLPLELQSIDYIEFYVGNARQAAYFYGVAFGFQLIAYAGLETGHRDHCSFVLEQGNIRIVLTSALSPNSEINRYVKAHGDGVYNIAFKVQDVKTAFTRAVALGATALAEPVTIKVEGGEYTQATIASYEGDVVHSLIERRNYKGFAPSFKRLVFPEDFLSSAEFLPPNSAPVGLIDVDHIAFNVALGKMNQWGNYYKTVFDFSQSQNFTGDEIATRSSSLKSKIMQDKTGKIKLPINEPAEGLHKSQVQEYLDFFRGPGVQHISFRTNDIVKTARQLKNNGVGFLKIPDAYYSTLNQRVGEIDEDIAVLKELQLLVDRDEEGYLLQIFTQSLVDRPTFFVEIIQRKGSDGFGNGNFKALFEAVEAGQANRGNL